MNGQPCNPFQPFVESTTQMCSWNKLRRYYATLSIILLNTTLLFVGINFLLYAAILVRHEYFSRALSIVRSYGTDLYAVYPDFSDDEVDQLLEETWRRPYVFEPFTQFKERPYRGKYVNVDANGFRVGKDQGPWPIDRENFNVFLFGGSTIFSYGLADDETVGSFLQELLNSTTSSRPVRVYNFGRGYYYSSQERILFEKLLLEGHIPDLAIFADGLNEFFYTSDEPNYSEELSSFLDNQWDVKGGISSLIYKLPIAKAVRFAARKQTSPEGKASDQVPREKKYNSPALLRHIIYRYLTNKKFIEAVAVAQSVQVAFVWQPVPTYKYNIDHHLFASKGFGRHTYSMFGYPMMADMYKNRRVGGDFFWCADLQEKINRPLYVDSVHYSRELSKAVSHCIYQNVREHGYLERFQQ